MVASCGFKYTETSGIKTFVGTPNCNAAHAAVLAALQKIGCPFIAPGASITQSQRGNLGEFIVFHISRANGFGETENFAPNAIQPLSGISGAGIDLTYVYFDPDTDQNDLIYIQEVKTTAAANLDYLSCLESDYKKLFSTDLNLNLHARLQVLSNAFEMERNCPEYAERVLKLGGGSPKECSRVRLLPTGVHGLGVGNPVQKMLAIRSSIVAIGWPVTSISPWAVAMSDIEDRLLRLARGRS